MLRTVAQSVRHCSQRLLVGQREAPLINMEQVRVSENKKCIWLIMIMLISETGTDNETYNKKKVS